MKILIATHNKKKFSELKRILDSAGVEAVSGDIKEAEETGNTFYENAYIKAKHACDETGFPAIADDSGLEVDALNGRPGIYSARYAGENASDKDRIEKLLSELKGVPEEKRTARFKCVIVCVYPNSEVISAEGVCEGKIANSPSGDDGFGYDPVFLVGERTFAQMKDSEKDIISHRGNALKLFLEKFKEKQNAYK